MTHQDQFLDVIDRDEAERRFRAALQLDPIAAEVVELHSALGRVLAEDIVAPIDVPSFDRSNFDGFAVLAADTFGAHEEGPRRLTLLAETIAAAVVPSVEIRAGNAVSIATGGMLPRGADAVVMVEHADVHDGRVWVRKPVTPGAGVAFAGTDMALGETVLRGGELLTSRDTGVLAAIGIGQIKAWRKPRVGVISTGDEIIEPGQVLQPGMIYDSNARVISDAVCELGGEPLELGIARDDLPALRETLSKALEQCDLVLLSGGTSKGAGDLSYRAVSELTEPGIVAHGVALKPGKPICLAASAGKAVVVLPGFPTSAIFTFHEFVAPILRQLAGRPVEKRDTVSARMAVKVNSEIGRTEYLLVGLVSADDDATPQAPSAATVHSVAFPMGKGSGSVTSFSRADGFVTIGRWQEIVDAGEQVDVQLLGRDIQAAELVVVGSHCVGLDYLLGCLQRRGIRTKFLAVGSTAGLEAARSSLCDLSGIHLLDARSETYNTPFLDDTLSLVPGYGRLQGVIFRRGDQRFEGRSAEVAIAAVAQDENCLMVNRNQGSGTRILIDRLLRGRQPNGYAIQPKSHNAVAAAVAQERADWGVAIDTVARQSDLGFLGLVEERYDFVVPRTRIERPAVKAFQELLSEAATRRQLGKLGFRPPSG